jgi:hypothetical protein
MLLRPRCENCGSGAHTICPRVSPMQIWLQSHPRNASQALAQAPPRVLPQSITNPPVRTRCCSFCKKPGHFKPKCEKYIKSLEAAANRKKRCCGWCRMPGHTITSCESYKEFLLNKATECKDKLLEYSVYPQIWEPHAQPMLFGIYDILTGHIKKTKTIEEIVYSAQNFIKKTPKPEKIRVILSSEPPTAQIHECSICMLDDIPSSNMAKLNCAHSFCVDCTSKVINNKPCCPFCRTNIKTVTVIEKKCVNELKTKSNLA